MALKKSYCLVTGGAGFIGSHLVERLLSDGHEVIVLDNFCTGRLQNLKSVQNNPRLRIEQVNIEDFDSIEPFFSSVERVFHLAALADIVPSIQQPLEYTRSNVLGTASALEASRLSGVRHFVYTASSSCYGIPDIYPTPETAEIHPQYPYALTKYLGERYTLHWWRVYHLPCVSLRLFNVYGPRSRTTGVYGAVFGVFLAQKIAGKPFTVVGDGTQTRDFTFVSDVVDALIQTSFSEIEGEVFNVGSGKTYSVNDLVSLLDGRVVHIPKRPGEPDCTLADISKISQILDWQPKVSFEEGVRMMLERIDDWKDAPVWNEKSIEAATREWFEHLEKPAGTRR